MFAGLGAARIRRLFARRASTRPAIIFIDELDAVGGAARLDNNSEREQTLNQLLVEMDGFDTTGDVVVIAASNLLEKLDPALLRPGRFDRQIFVSPPDVAGREAILEVHTRGKPLGPDVDLGARRPPDRRADRRRPREHLQRGGDLRRARRAERELAQPDFDAALERVVAGMQSRRALNEHERRVVAFHEAGHALCAELLPGVDRVHKISIVPRGRALGYTLNLPEEDRYLKTREELLDYMTMLLGGRAAEQLVFGAITTGASDDLQRVAEISRAMVHEYAMGTSITSRRSRPRAAPCPTARAQLRDEEQQHLADEAMRGGHAAASPSTARLDALAAALLRNEVLERADIDRIMAASRGWTRCAPAAPPPRPWHAPPPRDRARPRGVAPRDAPAAIDHIGVAVEDLDAALALYPDELGMPVVHRETVDRAGRRGGRCSTSARTTSSCSRRSGPTRRSASSSPSAGRAAPRRLPGRRHRRRARRAAGGRHAADRRAAAHRNPRLARRVHPSLVHRRRADRDRPTRGRSDALMADASSGSASASRAARCSPRGSATEQLGALRKALENGGDGWHELEAEDGPSSLDLAQVVYVRVEPTSTASASALDRAGSPSLELSRPALLRARIGHAAGRRARGAALLDARRARRMWLALGAAGAALDPARPRALAPSDGLRRHAPTASTRRSSWPCAVRARSRAELPPLIGTPTQLSFPSAHAASSAAASRVLALLPACRCARAATAMTLSRLYLGVHYPSDIAAGALLGTRRSENLGRDEGRHRRHAQRRQVLAVQRAHARRRRGGQLPVHDDRAERRDRAGRGRALGAGRRAR